jgi:hypothetical protein
MVQIHHCRNKIMFRDLVISFSILLLGLCTVQNIQSQNQAGFESGRMAVELHQFGSIRIIAPGLNDDWMIDRANIVVGTDESSVFTYRYDADTVEVPQNILPATYGNYELYGLIDNAYSGNPPGVKATIHIYGWAQQGFSIVRFIVKNIEESIIEAAIGLEILPSIDDQYGNESIRYLEEDIIVNIYKNTHVGFKLLSNDLFSLKMLGWSLEYGSDEAEFKRDLYTYLTSGTRDDSYNADADGSVVIMGQNRVSIAPGETTELYFAVAIGNDEESMVMNIMEAQAEYDVITSEIYKVGEQSPYYSLDHNYPNPFNAGTTINFSIPRREHVTLSVHNILGQRVRLLLNEEMAQGDHSIRFDASELPSGTYYYSILTDSYRSTKSMILLR